MKLLRLWVGGCAPVFLGRKAEGLKPEACHYPNLMWHGTMHKVEDAIL